MDQRRAARVPCDLRVLVMVHPAIFGPGVLLNVSSGGALLQTPLDLAPASQIELEVEGPGVRRFSITASIIRRELNQYGVAFRDTHPAALDPILRRAASDESHFQGPHQLS